MPGSWDPILVHRNGMWQHWAPGKQYQHAEDRTGWCWDPRVQSWHVQQRGGGARTPGNPSMWGMEGVVLAPRLDLACRQVPHHSAVPQGQKVDHHRIREKSLLISTKRLLVLLLNNGLFFPKPRCSDSYSFWVDRHQVQSIHYQGIRDEACIECETRTMLSYILFCTLWQI